MENTEEKGLGKNDDESQELVLTLPKEKNWEGTHLHLYQGFWYPFVAVKPVISFQKHFHAHDNDIILATTPKSGTTWLQAIIYLISNRSHFALSESPLLTLNPHDLVPLLEFDLYLKNQDPDLEHHPEPRIFSTHVPYTSLPTSITDSKCKIVYVCRNPLDQLISLWQFSLKLKQENADSFPLEEAFQSYCKGIHAFGPFWDHVLGYWKASQQIPDKVLFLQYEDLKENINVHMKRLAEFLGYPFSVEEEKEGVIEEISRLCSFNSMKNLEVNKKGSRPTGIPHSAFFRKGEVGDWSNYLTQSMAERMDKILQEKLKGSGLSFDLSSRAKKET